MIKETFWKIIAALFTLTVAIVVIYELVMCFATGLSEMNSDYFSRLKTNAILIIICLAIRGLAIYKVGSKNIEN